MLKLSQRPKNRNGNYSETSGDSGVDEPAKPVKYFGTDNYWIGQRVTDKINTNTPILRQFWEQNSLREQQEKQRLSQLVNNRSRRPFGFPKWRSNDAMTASLVASGKVLQLIPKDSQLPEHRKQKIEETERRAAVERQALQKRASNHKLSGLHKGKSTECLHVDYQPWYNRECIQSAISRERIGFAKDHFEKNDLSKRNYRGGIISYAPNQVDRGPIRNGFTNVGPSRSATSGGKSSYVPPEIPTAQQPHTVTQPSHVAPLSQQTVTMSPEHHAFLQYMRQNPNILSDFGIEVPKTFLNNSDNLQFETCQHSFTCQQMMPVQPVTPIPNRTSGIGRYVKNGAGSRHCRRLYDLSVKQIPENKRKSMQKLDQQKAGDSLIAAEIRATQEREDELRRSQSELGLPNLKETLENWRSGDRLSSAVSTGAINRDFSHCHGGPREMVASCDDLQWQQQQPYYKQNYGSSKGYPMTDFIKQDESASLTTNSFCDLLPQPTSIVPISPASIMPSPLRTSQQHQQQQQHPFQHHDHLIFDDYRWSVSLSSIRQSPVHAPATHNPANSDSNIVSPEFEQASFFLHSSSQDQDNNSPIPNNRSFKVTKPQDSDVMIYDPRRSNGASSSMFAKIP